MKINQIILTGIVSVIIALQAWTLSKVVTLSEDVASLKATVSMITKL